MKLSKIFAWINFRECLIQKISRGLIFANHKIFFYFCSMNGVWFEIIQTILGKNDLKKAIENLTYWAPINFLSQILKNCKKQNVIKTGLIFVNCVYIKFCVNKFSRINYFVCFCVINFRENGTTHEICKNFSRENFCD